jgi:hypothetical protein
MAGQTLTGVEPFHAILDAISNGVLLVYMIAVHHTFVIRHVDVYSDIQGNC